MTFTVLPAVDVADGRSVFGHGDPLDVALGWQADGAEWLHLVDLDAAFGRGSNAELLTAVIGTLDVPVELAGGIVDDASLDRALATGCARVSLGTGALADPDWCARKIGEHGKRIAVSLDVRVDSRPDGSVRHRLSARGGIGDGGDLWAALVWLDAAGCARYIVTDVSRDGKLSGPNLDLYKAVTVATPAHVIASGGIAELTDLAALADLAAKGLNLGGAVVGKALYAGRFTLTEALAAVRCAGR